PAPADGVLASVSLSEGDEAAPGAVLGLLNAGAAASDRQLPAGSQSTQAPSMPAGSRQSDVAANGSRQPGLSPLGRRLTRDNSLDAADISGTGRQGRITHKDLEAHTPDRNPRSPAKTRSTPAAKLESQRIPHDNMRKSIAEHMAKSLAT